MATARIWAAITAAVITACIASPAISQAVMVDPTSEEIVEALSPAGQRLLQRQKGVRSLRGIDVEETEDEVSINMRVEFEFDKATLTPQAVQALTALGTALKDDALDALKFQIVGHTDARGTDAYNQQLSEDRAQAVVQFLVARHGIERALLDASGMGETDLLIPQDPESALNRRVQIIAEKAP